MPILTFNPLASGNGATISQTEIDFGATPISSLDTVVTDAAILSSQKIICNLCYSAPTEKDLDELEMDQLVFMASANTGSFNLFVVSSDGSLLHDKFKINYTVY